VVKVLQKFSHIVRGEIDRAIHYIFLYGLILYNFFQFPNAQIFVLLAYLARLYLRVLVRIFSQLPQNPLLTIVSAWITKKQLDLLSSQEGGVHFAKVISRCD